MGVLLHRFCLCGVNYIAEPEFDLPIELAIYALAVVAAGSEPKRAAPL